MRIGSGGLGEPLARPTPSLQDTPLKPGCQLLTQLKPKKANLRKHLLPPRLRGRTPKARERVRILRSWTKPVGSSGLLGFALSCSFPLQGLCRLTGTPFCVSPEGRAASPCTHPSKKKKKSRSATDSFLPSEVGNEFSQQQARAPSGPARLRRTPCSGTATALAGAHSARSLGQTQSAFTQTNASVLCLFS